MDVFVPFNSEYDFVGREWVFAKIAKTLDIRAPCPNATVILGAIGSGKTLLLRQISQNHRLKDNILAHYECNEHNDVHHFIACLEGQIKSKINFVNSYDCNEENDTSDQLFQQSVLFPLLESQLINTEEQRYVIVIDSIDMNIDICQLISNHIHLLPKWLHLIVSARPKRLKGFTKMFSGSRKIVIDDMRKVNVINDMKGYIMHRIKKLNSGPMGHSGKKALNQIGIKSNGCFLYVKLILDCFERGLIGIEQIDEIGATLNGLYLALCTRLFDHNPQYEDDYKTIISLLLASPGNKISKDQFEKYLSWDSCLINEKIDELSLYLMVKTDKNMVELNHSSILEWITDVKHCTKRFLCDKSIGSILICLSKEILLPSDILFHITNSDMENFNVEHYALWLMLSCSFEDILDLIDKIEGDQVIEYIKKCKQLLTEKQAHVIKSKRDSLAFSSNFTNELPNNLTSGSTQFDHCIKNCDIAEIQVRFHQAMKTSDILILKEILNHDPDIINNPSIHYKQRTPLFWAIKSRNKEIVQLLIEYDVDVNAVCDNETQITPLMHAASENSLEICEILLEADADVDACDLTNRTPLVYAILGRASSKIIEMLLFWGAHTDYLDESGKSLLCLAANESRCSVEVIRLLVAVGSDELHRDNYGRTALHLASSHGNYEVVEVLLEIGGDALLHAKDNEGKIALHESSSAGHLETCRLLISEKTINELSHDGKSPIRAAAFNSHLDVITLLAENGGDINYVDADGRSTLYCIASGLSNNHNVIKTLKHLAKLGANCELKDFEGRTALHVSAWQGLKVVVETLIELGANVNAIDNEGRTPLHMCAWNGHSDIVNVLIDGGSNVDQVSTTQGATPLLIAAQQGHIDACAVLLDAGCDPSYKDFYGRNAQDVANNCGHRDISILIESRYFNKGEHCPTLSSHASTAETAAIGEIEALFDCPSKSCQNIRKDNPSESSKKHKKIISISKLTKLLH